LLPFKNEWHNNQTTSTIGMAFHGHVRKVGIYLKQQCNNIAKALQFSCTQFIQPQSKRKKWCRFEGKASL